MWGALLGVATVFALSASVALASPPGNNGTVKIHDGATDTEPIIKNEPHVCTFHLHFFFADPFQTGDWWIRSWPPTGDGSLVKSGSYDTNSDGEDRWPKSGDTALPIGHYKLFWEGDEDKLIKHKTFWTTCNPEEEGGPVESEPTPFQGAQVEPASNTGGDTRLMLALLVGGGSAAVFVLLRPFPRRIRND
jgi:hypothetical protein